MGQANQRWEAAGVRKKEEDVSSALALRASQRQKAPGAEPRCRVAKSAQGAAPSRS